MSTIAENAAAVKAAQEAIDAAIVAKGGTTTGGLNNAAAAIAALPSGGEEWVKPEEWPDIKSILDNDTETGFTNRCIILYSASSSIIVPPNGSKWRTADGYTTSRPNIVPTIDDGYIWVITYSNSKIAIGYESYTGGSERKLWVYSDIGTVYLQNLQYSYALEAIECKRIELPSGHREFFALYSLRLLKAESFVFAANTNFTEWFSDCRRLVRASMLNGVKVKSASSLFSNCFSLDKAPDIDTSEASVLTRMFYDCHSLKTVERLDLTSATDCQLLFFGCSSLISVPDILDIGRSNAQELFRYCHMLKKVPDTLDFRGGGTNHIYDFSGCFSLKRLPTHLYSNYSISFAQSTEISPESLAVFDGNGNVIGGMLYNLNTCPNSGQSFTFPGNVKSKFTAAEWETVKAAFAAKNWGCSPA